MRSFLSKTNFKSVKELRIIALKTISVRLLKPEMLKQDGLLFPVKDALMYIQAQPLGGGGKSFQGEGFFTAENPAFGAAFTYYLKEELKTKKARRQEAERAAARSGGNVALPSVAELSAEEEEEPPSIIFTVTDAAGKVVRRLTGPTTAGIQRVTWDLRYPAPNLAPPPNPDGDDTFGPPPGGPLVMPGAYKVSVAKRVNGVLTPFGQTQEFQVVVDGQDKMNVADRQALVDFQTKVARLQRAVSGATQAANALTPRFAAIRRALLDTPNAEKLLAEAAGLEKRKNEILKSLSGDATLRGRNMNLPASINERVGEIVGGQRMSTSRPTQTQVDLYAHAAAEFEGTLNSLRQLIEVDLARLEKQMEAAGAPWTPGRIPEWKDQ